MLLYGVLYRIRMKQQTNTTVSNNAGFFNEAMNELESIIEEMSN